MKAVLSALTFLIAALSFVIFFTVVRPDDFSVAAGASKPLSCETEASLLHVCRPHFLDESRASAAPE